LNSKRMTRLTSKPILIVPKKFSKRNSLKNQQEKVMTERECHLGLEEIMRRFQVRFERRMRIKPRIKAEKNFHQKKSPQFFKKIFVDKFNNVNRKEERRFDKRNLMG